MSGDHSIRNRPTPESIAAEAKRRSEFDCKCKVAEDLRQQLAESQAECKRLDEGWQAANLDLLRSSLADDEAIKQEREACARLCDDIYQYENVAAKAIRNREK